MTKGFDHNDEKAMRIAYLIAAFIQQKITPAEHDELDRWVEESDENMLLFEELTDEKNIEAGIKEMQEVNRKNAYKKLKNRILFTKEKRTRQLWPYAVAASLIIAAAGIYFFEFSNKKNKEQIIAEKPNADILPGTNKATLTLSDGRKIILDKTSNGNITGEAGTEIIKQDTGQLVYQANEKASEEKFNVLTVPKGGQFQLVLSDGTKVWLNAASSIRYPVSFSGSERKIEITGEAYFEVSKDVNHPFHVSAGNQDIKVLGTHFNVKAYEGEDYISTTLLEGKVEIKTNEKTLLLKPGEQSLTGGDGLIHLEASVDLDKVIAWKQGMFGFKNETIYEIMKQVSRWYDADISFQGKVENHFNATVSRNVPVSKLLKLLEETGGVHFKVEGKKITVLP